MGIIWCLMLGWFMLTRLDLPSERIFDTWESLMSVMHSKKKS